LILPALIDPTDLVQAHGLASRVKYVRLDRTLDRQRRENNPSNYGEKGRVKPGKKHWHSSKRQRRTHTLRREYYRKLAATP
jgi:putative transposase